MATVTSTTSPSASTVVSSASQEILTSLGTGSGVDTTSLVASLVKAQFAAKTADLKTRSETLTSQISSVSTIKSAISGFSTALDTLVKGGSISSQPTTSNAGILTATALAGARLSGLSKTIAVNQLASAQSATTKTAIADRTAAIGTGQFTLKTGSATYAADGKSMTEFTEGAGTAVTIDITSANNSLDGLMNAINLANAGVSASIITDADGSAYLSLKGTSGAAQAFTLEATTDDDSTLSRFNVGVGASGTAMSAVAQNAKLTVDGVAIQRTSNTISDLVDGVKLTLNSTSAGPPVTLGSQTPTAALQQAVSDVVATYNEVMTAIAKETDPINGILRSDPAAKALLQSMKGLTTKSLYTGAAPGAPTTLAEIGVTTNRDGTLALDTTRLGKALTDHPASVESMFAYSSLGINGLSAAITSISTNATSAIFGLGASNSKYVAQQTVLTDLQTKLDDASAIMSTRLTKQFAGSSARVTAYKATQTMLTNQIAQWNKN